MTIIKFLSSYVAGRYFRGLVVSHDFERRSDVKTVVVQDCSRRINDWNVRGTRGLGYIMSILVAERGMIGLTRHLYDETELVEWRLLSG